MQTVRIEIRGRSGFWSHAFHVEWAHQFPDRSLIAESETSFLIDPSWLEDVERVAAQCFCEVTRAPQNPHRRRWMRSFVRQRDDD